MFNKAFTGGACAPGEQTAGLASNQFTQALDTVAMGDAQA